MSAKQIKEIIEAYLKGTDFQEINTTISLQAVWEKIVGKPICKNTKILSFKRGILIIKTQNPVWRNELSLQKQELIKKLTKKEPSITIKNIIFK